MTESTDRMPAAFLGHGSPMNALELNRFTRAWHVAPDLRAVQWKAPDLGFDWAHRFDDAARTVLLDKPSDVESLREHPDFDRAVPTSDHFIPMLYFAGLASVSGQPVQELIAGCALGSISMTSYTLGMMPAGTQQGLEPAADIPDPSAIPADQTNL